MQLYLLTNTLTFTVQFFLLAIMFEYIVKKTNKTRKFYEWNRNIFAFNYEKSEWNKRVDRYDRQPDNVKHTTVTFLENTCIDKCVMIVIRMAKIIKF